MNRDNMAGIAGEITDLQKSTELYGHEIGAAYIAKLKIPRISGIEDEVIAAIPETAIQPKDTEEMQAAQPGDKLLIAGKVQKVRDNATGETTVFILADFAAIVEHPLYQNEIAITGEIMNIPAMRETPRGKKITDLMVRVDNELDGGGAYIPCICWQAAAEEMARYEDINLEDMAHRLYGWLYAPGIEYRQLYDTYDREYYSMAYISSKATVSDLAKRLLGEIEIEFTCKAYKRALKGERTITLTKAKTIYNTEFFTASPYIKITGNGGITLYINERAYGFKDVSEYIEIDSELMNAYKGDTLQNSKMLTTKFPKLTAGENNISWAGNVSKVEIIPRWCRL